MRKPRSTRVRTLSDNALEAELLGELVDWLTSPGVPHAPPRLEALYGAYSRRFLTHTRRCACQDCFRGYDESVGPIDGVPWPE